MNSLTSTATGIWTGLPDLLVTSSQQAPDDNDVVAGWTAFVLFVALIVAVAVLGFSLTKRLKNVAKAQEQGLYDPSTPRPQTKPLRGLAAARAAQRERAAAGDESGTGPTTAEQGDDDGPRP